ncbi:hypothetical protein [Thioalbus denitrificans]|uniref:HK97 gp10 family phage protein n=1 Tax=Thioalbus denitrificans TaxID=547122 RepID=A0A369CHB5_9GAMM|nr:hypothetical protein [Thioalbus denitrificans]RCX32076.1 hypothetical protein DFQ59_102429 [Thioalbus denitrificans]
MKTTSNALAIARRWNTRRGQLDGALRRGLRKGAAAVDREQVRNLSGSGADAPGSYPVPVRKGTLRGGHFFQVENARLAIVGNTTVYAARIHDERPFLDDAAEDVDAGEYIRDEMRTVFTRMVL